MTRAMLIAWHERRVASSQSPYLVAASREAIERLRAQEDHERRQAVARRAAATRRHEGTEFEVVWNGTRGRAGASLTSVP